MKVTKKERCHDRSLRKSEDIKERGSKEKAKEEDAKGNTVRRQVSMEKMGMKRRKEKGKEKEERKEGRRKGRRKRVPERNQRGECEG